MLIIVRYVRTLKYTSILTLIYFYPMFCISDAGRLYKETCVKQVTTFQLMQVWNCSLLQSSHFSPFPIKFSISFNISWRLNIQRRIIIEVSWFVLYKCNYKAKHKYQPIYSECINQSWRILTLLDKWEQIAKQIKYI